MARQSGRDLRIKYDGTNVLACVTTKTISTAHEPIEVTGDCDSGWVTYLERYGKKGITFDADGVTTDTAFNKKCLEGTGFFSAAKIEFLNANGTVSLTLTADLVVSSYSVTGATDGALEFSASFATNGVVTATP